MTAEQLIAIYKRLGDRYFKQIENRHYTSDTKAVLLAKYELVCDLQVELEDAAKTQGKDPFIVKHSYDY